MTSVRIHTPSCKYSPKSAMPSKLVTAIIRPAKLADVLESLLDIPVDRLLVHDILGSGSRGKIAHRIATSTLELDLLKKIKVEINVAQKDVGRVIEKISRAARTGHSGDGKIFVMNVPQSY